MQKGNEKWENQYLEAVTDVCHINICLNFVMLNFGFEIQTIFCVLKKILCDSLCPKKGILYSFLKATMWIIKNTTIEP